jgi:GH15 family glucan-1,4-alpha-glucosidase
MPVAISDYAMIGDGRTAALVDRGGTIAWLCWPRFDSDACFAAILGGKDFGHWTISAADKSSSSRRYVDNSLILETTFGTETGVATLTDFLCAATNAQYLVRVVRGISGEVAMTSCFSPSGGSGRLTPKFSIVGEALTMQCDGLCLNLHASDASVAKPGTVPFTVRENEEVAFILCAGQRLKNIASVAKICRDREERFWHDWCAQCTYQGPWRNALLRSLVTLKALVYAPSGGIIAAPTTSLPEEIGGVRNWDYRYCWLRDSTFTVLALLHAGYRDEAKAWVAWLLRAITPDRSRTQPVYGVTGERRLREYEADWLPGFCKSRPVRFGNDAYLQYQLDVYGEVQDTLHQWRQISGSRVSNAWKVQREMLGRLEAIWRKPDAGIWEQRGPPEYFTQSRALAWVAVDRAVKAIERFGFGGPLERWKTLRSKLHREVCEKGFDKTLNAFTRSYGSHSVDASTLLMPIVGFLPATDPRVVGTVEAIAKHLGRDGFIYRYDQSREDDGIRQDEGAFLPCSFWLADNMILQKREDEAAALFEKLLGAANDVGLMSEEYDPSTRTQLGNTPQALTHLSLVHTALNLEGFGPAHTRAEAA